MCLPVVGKSDSGSEVMKTDRNTWAEKGRETDRKTETDKDRERTEREGDGGKEGEHREMAGRDREKSPFSAKVSWGERG